MHLLEQMTNLVKNNIFDVMLKTQTNIIFCTILYTQHLSTFVKFDSFNLTNLY